MAVADQFIWMVPLVIISCVFIYCRIKLQCEESKKPSVENDIESLIPPPPYDVD